MPSRRNIVIAVACGCLLMVTFSVLVKPKQALPADVVSKEALRSLPPISTTEPAATPAADPGPCPECPTCVKSSDDLNAAFTTSESFRVAVVPFGQGQDFDQCPCVRVAAGSPASAGVVLSGASLADLKGSGTRLVAAVRSDGVGEWADFLVEYAEEAYPQASQLCAVCYKLHDIEKVRQAIHPPPRHGSPVMTLSDSFAEDHAFSQNGQDNMVLEILNDQREGFFIEAGAFDGQTRSNSLLLERKYGWSGLLVEANPHLLQQVFGRRRTRSQVLPGCLAITMQPTTLEFKLAGGLGGIDAFVDKARIKRDTAKYKDLEAWKGVGEIVQADCYPTYDTMIALRVRTIDYWSLDTEGSELAILKTWPWKNSLVRIKLLGVEGNTESHRRNVNDFLVAQGMVPAGWRGGDLFFRSP